jgi:hypothetical protein
MSGSIGATQSRVTDTSCAGSISIRAPTSPGARRVPGVKNQPAWPGYTDLDFLTSELIQIGGENLMYGLEAFHEDGPWDHGADYRRLYRVQLLEVRGLNRSHPGKLQSSHDHGSNGWPPAAGWIRSVRCRRGV